MLRRYAEAQARLEHAGGWNWRDRAAAALRGLGFRDADLDRPLSTFSGGELTRASLGRALAGDPDLLLLDEPTNHLDVDSLEWLEQELTTLDAAIMIVAHDRWFLEAVTTAVLELDGGRSFYFSGPWHEWRREKAARATHAAKTVARVDEDIERLERFVERFRYKKSKAKQAQAKLTQIGRLRKERDKASGELDAADAAPAHARLRVPEAGPHRPGRARRRRACGSPPATSSCSTAPSSCSSAASTSRSSARTAPARRPCSRRCSATGTPPRGSIKLGHGVQPAYFSQHDVELDERGSVLSCAMAMTGLQRPQAQSLLGRFLFSGWDEHEKPVTALSGGERRRLALAAVVASGREPARAGRADEPPRPGEPRGARGGARGVSRERSCSSRTTGRSSTPSPTAPSRSRRRRCGRTTAAGPISCAPGREADASASAAAAAARVAAPREGRSRRRPRKERRGPTELERIETRIGELERQIATLEAALAADWTDMDTLTSHRAARDELQTLLTRWEELFAGEQSAGTEAPAAGS